VHSEQRWPVCSYGSSFRNRRRRQSPHRVACARQYGHYRQRIYVSVCIQPPEGVALSSDMVTPCLLQIDANKHTHIVIMIPDPVPFELFVLLYRCEWLLLPFRRKGLCLGSLNAPDLVAAFPSTPNGERIARSGVAVVSEVEVEIGVQDEEPVSGGVLFVVTNIPLRGVVGTDDTDVVTGRLIDGQEQACADVLDDPARAVAQPLKAPLLVVAAVPIVADDRPVVTAREVDDVAGLPVDKLVDGTALEFSHSECGELRV